MHEILLYTNMLCECPGFFVFNGVPLSVSVGIENCTEMAGPHLIDWCAQLIAQSANTSSPVVSCTQQSLQCTPIDSSFNPQGIYPGHGFLQVKYVRQNCTIELDTVVDVYGNGTLLQGETVLISDSDFPLMQCSYSLENITTTEFDNSLLNICYRPAYYSVCNQFQALNISFESLDFYLNYGRNVTEDEFGCAMVFNGLPTVDLIWRDNGMFGLNVDAPGAMAALQLQMGLNAEQALGRKKANHRPPIGSIVQINDSRFADFLFYESILDNTPGTSDDRDEVFQFPYINSIVVTFVNRDAADNTTFLMFNCNFSDIDRRVLETRGANTTMLLNNSAVRCGGRSLDCNAAVLIVMNPKSPNSLVLGVGNNMTQTRPVTYPLLGDKVLPSYEAWWWIGGIGRGIFDACSNANLTIDQCEASALQCCPKIELIDNFICGLPFGLRLVGEVDPNNDAIIAGLPPGSSVPFSDNLVGLRIIAIDNNANWDGTVCDLVLGDPNHDFFEDNVRMCVVRITAVYLHVDRFAI